MRLCEVCGNPTEDPFRVDFDGDIHFYDTLECTVYALSPQCDGCGDEVIGVGIDVGAAVFCSARCAIELARAS